jgi:hypothetical protein
VQKNLMKLAKNLKKPLRSKKRNPHKFMRIFLFI